MNLLAVDNLFVLMGDTLMRAGGFICHQMPERSPHLFGAQMPLCWRCTGILFGGIVFLLWLVTKRRLPPLLLSLVLASLMLIDVAAAMLGVWGGANTVRFITGALWGTFGTAALMTFAVTAVNAKLRSSRA